MWLALFDFVSSATGKITARVLTKSVGTSPLPLEVVMKTDHSRPCIQVSDSLFAIAVATILNAQFVKQSTV